MTSPADLWAAARAEVADRLRSWERQVGPFHNEFNTAIWRGYLGVLDRHRPNGPGICPRCTEGSRDYLATWPCPEVAAVLDSLRATGWQG